MNPLGKGVPDRLRNDGSPVEVPVIVVNGAHDGPVVCLIGANHGDEYNGPAVIGRLYHGLEPDRLKGAVIGVPVVNPLAFYTVSRTVTLDYEHFNFNRIWPGDPRGVLTQRIAHAVFTECVTKASYVVDYHDGGPDLQARFLIVGAPPPHVNETLIPGSGNPLSCTGPISYQNKTCV